MERYMENPEGLRELLHEHIGKVKSEKERLQIYFKSLEAQVSVEELSWNEERETFHSLTEHMNIKHQELPLKLQSKDNSSEIQTDDPILEENLAAKLHMTEAQGQDGLKHKKTSLTSHRVFHTLLKEVQSYVDKDDVSKELFNELNSEIKLLELLEGNIEELLEQMDSVSESRNRQKDSLVQFLKEVSEKVYQLDSQNKEKENMQVTNKISQKPLSESTKLYQLSDFTTSEQINKVNNKIADLKRLQEEVHNFIENLIDEYSAEKDSQALETQNMDSDIIEISKENSDSENTIKDEDKYVIIEWKEVLKKLGEQLDKRIKCPTDDEVNNSQDLHTEDIIIWTEELNRLKEELDTIRLRSTETKKTGSFSKSLEIKVVDNTTNSRMVKHKKVIINKMADLKKLQEEAYNLIESLIAGNKAKQESQALEKQNKESYPEASEILKENITADNQNIIEDDDKDVIIEWKDVLRKLAEQLDKGLKASADDEYSNSQELTEQDINIWTEELNSLKEELGDFKQKRKKTVSFSKITEISVYDSASDSHTVIKEVMIGHVDNSDKDEMLRVTEEIRDPVADETQPEDTKKHPAAEEESSRLLRKSVSGLLWPLQQCVTALFKEGLTNPQISNQASTSLENSLKGTSTRFNENFNRLQEEVQLKDTKKAKGRSSQD